jgi:hypothetical protein
MSIPVWFYAIHSNSSRTASAVGGYHRAQKAFVISGCANKLPRHPNTSAASLNVIAIKIELQVHVLSNWLATCQVAAAAAAVAHSLDSIKYIN